MYCNIRIYTYKKKTIKLSNKKNHSKKYIFQNAFINQTHKTKVHTNNFNATKK